MDILNEVVGTNIEWRGSIFHKLFEKDDGNFDLIIRIITLLMIFMFISVLGKWKGGVWDGSCRFHSEISQITCKWKTRKVHGNYYYYFFKETNFSLSFNFLFLHQLLFVHSLIFQFFFFFCFCFIFKVNRTLFFCLTM